MKYSVKEIIRMGFGWVLVLVGTIGWVLPIIPGVPLMLLGLGLVFGAARVRALRILLRRWWCAQRKLYWGK